MTVTPIIKKKAPLYNNIKGVSYYKQRNKWRAYMHESEIGKFDTRAEALEARLRAEDIYRNILANLEVISISYKRDNNNVFLRATVITGEVIEIDLGTLYTTTIKSV